MTGLDTNVLVRYLVQDDLEQARAATEAIETRCSKAHRGFISLVVLCELVWVLSRAYRLKRKMIGDVVRRILVAEDLEVERAEIAWKALRLYESEPGDLSDYLIGLVGQEYGAVTTLTFDRNVARSDLFELLR